MQANVEQVRALSEMAMTLREGQSDPLGKCE